MTASADLARAQQLTRMLIERSRRLESMQTPAVMEYSSAQEHLKAREEIIVRRPASLRVEAYSPMGVAAVVAASDSQIAVFRSSGNTLMRGKADAQTLARFAQIPLAPQPAVNLLMGLAPDGDALGGAVSSVGVEGDLLVATFKREGGSSVELGFSGENLALVRLRDQPDSINCEVRYSDYRDIGGIMFTHQLEADFPIAGTRVKFRYQRPIINGPVAQSLFILMPAPGTHEIDLGVSGLLLPFAPAATHA
jgi:hypothetical protein